MSRRSRRTLSRRSFLQLSAFAGTTAFLGARSGISLASPLRQPAETSSISFASFNINWANNVFNDLADHFGWLADEGIEEQEMLIIDQGQIFPGLMGGSLQFAAQDTDAVANSNLAGVPIVFIANYRWKEPWIFAVSEEIETVEDLYGKTVSAGGAGGRNEWNSRTMIERLGGDPDQINWQPISGGSDARVNAFIEGQIDGVNMFDRHRPLVEEVGGWLIYDDLEEVPQDCYCVNREWMEDNERTIIGYLKATTLARQFVMDLDNKDEVIEIMTERGYEWPQAFIDQYERQIDILNPTGHFDIAAMEKLIADSVLTGSLEEEIDWHEFCEMSFLNTAYEELGQEDMVQDYSGDDM